MPRVLSTLFDSSLSGLLICFVYVIFSPDYSLTGPAFNRAALKVCFSPYLPVYAERLTELGYFLAHYGGFVRFFLIRQSISKFNLIICLFFDGALPLAVRG